MANTVITSTTNSIKVIFNDDSTKVGIDRGTYRKYSIISIKLHSDHAEIISQLGDRWIVSNGTNSINSLIIDSIDTVGPSSLSDLYDKLIALIQ